MLYSLNTREFPVLLENLSRLLSCVLFNRLIRVVV